MMMMMMMMVIMIVMMMTMTTAIFKLALLTFLVSEESVESSKHRPSK